MLRAATPERIVHVKQIHADDIHLTEITRRLRETMSESAQSRMIESRPCHF